MYCGGHAASGPPLSADVIFAIETRKLVVKMTVETTIAAPIRSFCLLQLSATGYDDVE
jgi:hypothetical protein